MKRFNDPWTERTWISSKFTKIHKYKFYFILQFYNNLIILKLSFKVIICEIAKFDQ